MKLPNEEPMNLVKDRTPETPDTGAEAAELAGDKDLEKIALKAGGPDLKGKYHDRVEAFVASVQDRYRCECGAVMNGIHLFEGDIGTLCQCPKCKTVKVI